MGFDSFVGEFLGLMAFVLIILVSGNPMIIAFGLLGAIFMASCLSKGILNPAVLFGLVLKGDISVPEGMWYLGGQLAGAAAGVAIYQYSKKVPVDHFYRIVFRDDQVNMS